MKCNECPEVANLSNKWEAIRRAEEGWYFGKDKETCFCPKHLPDWVKKWRANKTAKR
jgi:hypothetical protein